MAPLKLRAATEIQFTDDGARYVLHLEGAQLAPSDSDKFPAQCAKLLVRPRVPSITGAITPDELRWRCRGGP